MPPTAAAALPLLPALATYPQLPGQHTKCGIQLTELGALKILPKR